MPTTRRQFIKRSAGMVTVTMLMPKIWLNDARAQSGSPNGNRKFVIIALDGGNDSLNTVVPYTQKRYYDLRPTLAFKESELKSADGRSTIISDQLGLHPAMIELKEMLDQGKVAIVNGVGSPKSDLSHFSMADQWHFGDPDKKTGKGWLTSYLDQAGAGGNSLPAVSLRAVLPPKTFIPSRVGVPNIQDLADYGIKTDRLHPEERSDIIAACNAIYSSSLTDSGLLGEAARTSSDALNGSQRIQTDAARYSSTVVYPAGDTFGRSLKMVAQVMTTIPELSLFYVSTSGFDTHGRQIDGDHDNPSRLSGQHATLLGGFSKTIKAFHDDLTAHNLASNTVIMVWSEFSRRCQENASLGTDHGNAGSMFIIGDPVTGGIYGDYPSLDAGDLDAGGNMKITVDYRSVYSTILSKWLNGNPEAVLGGRFGDVGFLG